MTKKNDFDLSAIGKKMNLSGIMDNVKSIISPTSITIDAEDGDEVGALLAHLNDLVKEISVEHEKQEQRLGQISKTSAQIYALLQKDHPAPAAKKSAKTAEAEPAETTVEQEVENDTITPADSVKEEKE